MNGLFCLPQKLNNLTTISNKNQILKHKIHFDEMIYLQTSISQKNVITVFTTSNKIFTYRMSLKNIVDQNKNFIFISKSTIVNLEQIVKTNSTFSVIYLGDDGHKLRVSRKFTKPLITRLKEKFYM